MFGGVSHIPNSCSKVHHKTYVKMRIILCFPSIKLIKKSKWKEDRKEIVFITLIFYGDILIGNPHIMIPRMMIYP